MSPDFSLKASPLNVLVVDDSAVVRMAMPAVLSRDPGIEVQAAADPIIAMQKMKLSRPDVIILDLELPRMDGMTFLRKIMREDPIPVVICSAHTGEGTALAIRALEEGALEVITKPRLDVQGFLEESAVMIIDAVRAAASARLFRKRKGEPRQTADVMLPPPVRKRMSITTEKVVAIGASTGGTEALHYLLQTLPSDTPGIVIVQHMPEEFTRAFAARLDQGCALQVKEAENNDEVTAGRALVAPGNRHMLLARSGSHYRVEVRDGPLVSRHRPSVDVLFRSAAQSAGGNAVGVIMTGMGDDGAEGLLEMKRAGAWTIAQDEASCVVFGMPREAIARGAANEIVSLNGIPASVLRRMGRQVD
ncbi:MAG: chemotaxis response regulator protein-glutamate methylesterase [Vicinamibacteria bacterium]|nr:chemotaxis response regulator protein-glutamate methylesterase [Vicinamibacteria bacterium]